MRRRALRGLAVTAVACAATLGQVCVAGSGYAESGTGPFNEMPGKPLAAGPAVFLFVVLPLVILLATAALVWLPGVARSPRYRPQRGWSAPPLWFAGPTDAATAPAAGDDLVRGGAHGEW